MILTMRIREHYYEWDILYIKCATCKIMKESSMFHKNKRNKFWIDNHCKECESVRRKKRCENDEYRKKRNERNKIYRKNNKEKIKEYRSNYLKSHRKEQREYAKKYRLKKPKMTKEIYNRRKQKAIYANMRWIENIAQAYWFDIKKFHAKAWWYARRHNLIPNYCMVCGSQWKTDLHHPSYDGFEKRKEVVFVCRSCHKLIHAWELQCHEPVDLIQLNAHMPKILSDKDLENVYT